MPNAMHMLDTNTCSALMREWERPWTRVRQQLRRCQARVCMSVLVEAELLYGLEKQPSASRTAQYEWLRSLVSIAHLDAEVRMPDRYAELRAAQERRGAPLGPMDMLIAAHAKALGAVLVSDDRAFTRIPDLALENWLMPESEHPSAGGPSHLREASAAYGSRAIGTPLPWLMREVGTVGPSWGGSPGRPASRDRAAANHGSLLAVS